MDKNKQDIIKVQIRMYKYGTKKGYTVKEIGKLVTNLLNKGMTEGQAYQYLTECFRGK